LIFERIKRSYAMRIKDFKKIKSMVNEIMDLFDNNVNSKIDTDRFEFWCGNCGREVFAECVDGKDTKTQKPYTNLICKSCRFVLLAFSESDESTV